MFVAVLVPVFLVWCADMTDLSVVYLQYTMGGRHPESGIPLLAGLPSECLLLLPLVLLLRAIMIALLLIVIAIKLLPLLSL